MISFEHANANCTGSQMVVDFKSSKSGKSGCFTFCIAPQMTAPVVVGKRKRIPAEFSGDSARAELDAKKVTHLLLVLEGHATSTNFGKGVFDNGDGYCSQVHCDRVYEPAAGFAFHIITRYDGSRNAVHEQRILLNTTEATALARAIASSMGRAAFGE